MCTFESKYNNDKETVPEQRERVIPTAQVPTVIREGRESEVASSSRNSPVSGITERLPFLILDETSKYFPKFNATGSSLLI